MKTPRRQQGLGMLALLAIAVMVGFFVMAGIRITPGYVEYLTVRDTVMRVAQEYDSDQDTIGEMRRDLAGYLNTNQIRAIRAQDVDITRKDGKIIINASYEDRIPLFWRFDAIVKYDDLIFVAGEQYSE